MTRDFTKACGAGALAVHQHVSSNWRRWTRRWRPQVPKAIMDHKVIQYLRAVNGDKSLFRQWHQRFVTALGQYDQVREEIVQHLVKETDLGKELDIVVEELRAT